MNAGIRQGRHRHRRASRGIGAAIAARLGQDGYDVVVTTTPATPTRRRRSWIAIAAPRAAARSRCGPTSPTRPPCGNCSTPRSRASAASTCWSTTPASCRPRCRGSPTPTTRPSTRCSPSTLRRGEQAGSFNTMREAARRGIERGGRVVNFSSSVIGLAMPGYAVYAATKSAIETMTNILAKELRGRDITVNAVAPGPTATGLFLNGKTPLSRSSASGKAAAARAPGQRRKTSPTPSRCSSARAARGSTARRCAPTAAFV